jgi:hypothetical protein
MTSPATLAGSAATAATARFARGPLLGAIVVAFGWHLASNLPSMLNRLEHYHSPAAAVAQWAVFALVGIVAAVDALHGRRDPVRAAVAIGVLQVVVIAQLVTSSPDLVFNVGDWAWSNFGWFAILLLWRWPLPWLLAALAANTAVTLAILLVILDLDRLALSRFAMVVLGAGAIQVALAGGGRSLEPVAQRAYEAASTRAEAETRRAAAELVHADRQRRYREIGHSVRDLLGDLAASRLDTSDPDVQRRCAIEASRLRRLIAEHDDDPDPLIHELRACADVAERRGVAVSLHTTGEVPTLSVSQRRSLTEAPMHVLAAARTQARVTVLATVSNVEVSVVADTDLDPTSVPASTEAIAEADAPAEVKLTRDGEALWVRTWLRRGR